ncbi:hypothetical protein NMY22_g14719 [Coprinellus aureogranulatus]|nr:hypothetical protein NMY22_g14719 [Coprinellus aureogranulatus]
MLRLRSTLPPPSSICPALLPFPFLLGVPPIPMSHLLHRKEWYIINETLEAGIASGALPATGRQIGQRLRARGKEREREKSASTSTRIISKPPPPYLISEREEKEKESDPTTFVPSLLYGLSAEGD